MVRAFRGRGQTAQAGWFVVCTAGVTLLLRDPWFADVRQKARVSGAASGIVGAGLCETELAIYGVPNLKGVAVALAVVFPPANGAQGHGVWRFQRPAAATLASKANRCRPHAEMDGISTELVYSFAGSLCGAQIWRTDLDKALSARLFFLGHVISESSRIEALQSAPQGE